MNIPLSMRAFLFGALAAGGALLVELVFLSSQAVFSASFTLSPPVFPEISILTLFLLAGTEEISKLILLKKAFSKNSSIKLTHLFSFGLGFALVEASLLSVRSFPLGATPDILSTLSIIVLHCATVLLLVRFCLKQKRIISCFTGFLLVLAIHFVYNLSILYQLSLLLTTMLAFGSFAIALIKIKSSLR